jgi:transcription initiation factor TFIID subunit TAF12
MYGQTPKKISILKNLLRATFRQAWFNATRAPKHDNVKEAQKAEESRARAQQVRQPTLLLSARVSERRASTRAIDPEVPASGNRLSIRFPEPLAFSSRRGGSGKRERLALRSS